MMKTLGYCFPGKITIKYHKYRFYHPIYGDLLKHHTGYMLMGYTMKTILGGELATNRK